MARVGGIVRRLHIYYKFLCKSLGSVYDCLLNTKRELARISCWCDKFAHFARTFSLLSAAPLREYRYMGEQSRSIDQLDLGTSCEQKQKCCQFVTF